LKVALLAKGAPTIIHYQSVDGKIKINPVDLLSYDMLLGWGLTTNP